MDYEKKYKGALARCKWLLSIGMISEIAATDMFRELIDDNSENVRREIINIFHSLADGKIPVQINFADIFTWLERQGKKKSAWGKDDEYRVEILYALCEEEMNKSSVNSTAFRELQETRNWLNSLKERMGG